MSYNHKEVEKKWQKYWAKNNTFNTHDDHEKPKFYALDMGTTEIGRAHV